MKYNKGFTLIELLVVIAIIGILASVILVAVNVTRAKSRDAIRKQELVELRKAIEMYYFDYGYYPKALSYTSSLNVGCGNTVGVQSSDWIPGLAPTYIQALPTDPYYTDPTACKGYIYRSDGTDYKIMAFSSVETGSVNGTQPFTRIPTSCPTQPAWWNAGTGQSIFAVFSPGACAW